MAATALGNPAGAVWVADFGAPKTFTGKAYQNISGGVLVYFSGAAGAVSSGTNSFVTSDVGVCIDASGGLFNGIALTSTASGGAVPVATEGVFILVANGTVTAGTTVICDGNNSVRTGTTAGHVIGRALTEAASGSYCLVQLRA